MQEEIVTVLETISRLEKELGALRLQVAKLAAKQVPTRRRTRGSKTNDKDKPKSLYGILPPMNLTMEDYRAVRRSGTPRSLREP